MNDDDRALLTAVADYQFGRGTGVVLFPAGAPLTVTRTSSGRPRQIHGPAGRLATYGISGRLTLGVAGGRRLHDAGDGDRVVVGDESEPYVREGRNVFAKFVAATDDTIRPRDEVLVEHARGALLGVGRAVLGGCGMASFETGVAVQVRDGVED